MPEKKTVELDKLAKLSQKARKSGKTVVHCHGCFDLLHPGHVKYFEEAGKMGDLLIVTLTPDRFVDKGPNRPVFPEEVRIEMIAALEAVDYVALNRWPTAVETLRLIKPTCYVKGEEFEKRADITGKLQEEQRVLEEIGAELKFTHSSVVYSSTKLLNEQFGLLPDDLMAFLLDFRKEHHGRQLQELLDRMRDLKVLVIGDAIIDDYHYVKPQGKSPKANVITTQYSHNESGIGGSLCIANHLASFCNDVRMMTVLGEKDSWEDYIRKRLPDHVRFMPYLRPGVPTTNKRRYLEPVFLSKIFEVHFYDDSPTPPELEDRILEDLEQQLKEVDLVLVGDFGHGMMTPRLIELLCRGDAYTAITVQTNSTNFGFNYITKYRRTHFFSIDERELRLASHDRIAQVEELGPQLARLLSAEVGIITLGKEGSVLFDSHQEVARTPVLSGVTKDPVGAGDAFFTLAAPFAYMGAVPGMVTFVGNAAGALAANIVGNNEAIRRSEFRKFVNGLLK